MIRLSLFLSFLLCGGSVGLAQQPKAESAAKTKAKAKAKVPAPLAAFPTVGETTRIGNPERQADLPSAAYHEGAVFIAHLEWDGTDDSIVLSRDGEVVATLAENGVFHAPAVALAGDGTVWTAWGLTRDNETVDLVVRSWLDGSLGEEIVLADSDAAEAFVVGGTDSAGRAWFAWQSMRAGEGDIYARFHDPGSGNWSDEIAIATQRGGDWEPRISFDQEGNAWVLYDSSRGNEFNLYLVRVSPDGTTQEFPVGHTDRYEARGSLALDVEGTGFWIAAERGRVRWGLDARGHDNSTGLNAQKEVLFGRFDIASGAFSEIPLGPAGEAGTPVNLPEVGLSRNGDPWVAYRYFERVLWHVAVTNYRRESGKWTARRRLEGASYGQDRRSVLLPSDSEEAALRIVWASDGRTTKEHQVSGVFLASLDAGAKVTDAIPAGEPKDLSGEPFAPSQATPERPADERHVWTIGGRKFGLYWGDLHRHTDISNCRTGFDGTIVEHFRYAYDIAKLDYLGTTDHTDIGKYYHPYEWWHNQRMHDAVHSPGRFNSLYAYEREQRWPWGHRNVVFAQRGGPMVYIKRGLYRASPWQADLPVKPGIDEIHPTELWDILNRYGQPAALISHTGATGMGTDWTGYDGPVDARTENLVEIFQGARVSYEAEGAPQPTAGLKPEEKYTADTDKAAEIPLPPEVIASFGDKANGTYQTALRVGQKLGVFTSSDHISQHVSYGGVYCETFDREGILEGFKARRTVAATDKIYLEFTCNGELLGTEMATKDDPKLWLRVDGTAPLARVTIIRNEQDWKVFDEIEGNVFETEVIDEAMREGENRYYVRVEQADGNMAWCSPVWVTRE